MNKFIRALLLVALLATALPLAAPAAADGGSQYTVRSGDSLIRIARNNDVTLQALVDANKAAFPCLARPTPCPILTGQKLSLPAAKNIVTMAVEAGSFNTLVAAVQAAGLVEALQGPGPFTVLAPTDAAFAKLPKATLEALLANPDKLREVLLYHVIPAKARSTDVVKLTSAPTLQGQAVAIKASGGTVRINNARVVVRDVPASNGVIHAIDSVILPPNFTLATKDIVDTAVSAGSFNTLVAAVQAAGLVDALKGPGPFTVFAPTDAAFAKLPAGTIEALLADPATLQQILLYHVVPGRVMAADVVKLKSATTLQGQPVTIKVSGGKVMINNAQVIITDVEASNGVIHVIDTVILPPAK